MKHWIKELKKMIGTLNATGVMNSDVTITDLDVGGVSISHMGFAWEVWAMRGRLMVYRVEQVFYVRADAPDIDTGAVIGKGGTERDVVDILFGQFALRALDKHTESVVDAGMLLGFSSTSPIWNEVESMFNDPDWYADLEPNWERITTTFN